jgi:predicted AlkP superfamily pyrophosphatase or phosphodiesterase
MSKTILVLLDGCGFEAATENLGYLEHLVESGLGSKYKIMGELPSLSRPMYETILTGLPVYIHNISNNLDVRRSKQESIFSICHKSGFSTAASAYYWISELYCSAPFQYVTDRIRLHSDGLICNGIFYYEDCYPDSHVFSDAEFLRTTCNPDFLLIHSMNIDDEGHKHGVASSGYNAAVARAGLILSVFMPLWIAEGYNIVITSDHGMNAHHLHGGNTLIQREVPLYLFGAKVRPGNFCEESVSELADAPLICSLLGLEPPTGMKRLADLGVKFFYE